MASSTSLAERFGRLFNQPAVLAGMVVLAGVILVLGEIQSRPIRAQVERERNLQLQREVAVEKALGQYTETMRQDNEVERKAWEKRLLQKDEQMQGVMEQIARWMKAEGWKGELKPRMDEEVTPELSDLRRIGLGVELVSPRSVSARMKDSDQVRLLRLLRKISEISAPHVVRRLEVDQNPDGEMRAKVELEFFRLKTDG
jgi:hypothetical protein